MKSNDIPTVPPSMRTLVEWINPFFWKRWTQLIGPDDLLRSAAFGFHPDQEADAKYVWSWLGSPEAESTLARYCSAEGPWPGADAKRILANAKLAFSTGVAAGYLRHVSASDGAIDACLTGLARASGFPADENIPLTQPMTGRVWAADRLPTLDQLLAAMPETVSAAFPHTYCKPALLLWLHYWLSGRQVGKRCQDPLLYVGLPI
jgi:hypothetical protein